MDYGTITERTSYQNGKIASQTREKSVSIIVIDKSSVTAEFLRAYELIKNKQSCYMTFEVHADPETFRPKYIVKRWIAKDRER